MLWRLHSGQPVNKTIAPHVEPMYASGHWQTRTPEEKKRDDIYDRDQLIQDVRRQRRDAWIRGEGSRVL